MPEGPQGTFRDSEEEIKMFKQALILAMLPFAVSANASCVTVPLEMGDIGPGSELVCNELEHRFPGAVLAIQGRSIHSPTEVSVAATVDGRPMGLRYRLTGADWRLVDPGAGVLDAGTQGSSPSIRSVADRAPRKSLDVGQIVRRRLFEPSPGELRDEAAGRIYIYEGLRTTDIEGAMDEEFNRVQSMMFIRVKPSDDSGKGRQAPGSEASYVQDDGC